MALGEEGIKLFNYPNSVWWRKKSGKKATRVHFTKVGSGKRSTHFFQLKHYLVQNKKYQICNINNQELNGNNIFGKFFNSYIKKKRNRENRDWTVKNITKVEGKLQNMDQNKA